VTSTPLPEQPDPTGAAPVVVASSPAPAPVLGTGIGGNIVLTNTRTILRSLDVTGWASTTIYLVVVGVWAAAVAIAFAKLRNGEFDRAAVDEEAPTASTEAGR